MYVQVFKRPVDKDCLLIITEDSQLNHTIGYATKTEGFQLIDGVLPVWKDKLSLLELETIEI